MKTARLGALAALSLGWTVAFSTPTVLIYQAKPTILTKDDVAVDISDYIGKEFDGNGRLFPIIYSSKDLTFRAAVAKGTIKDPSTEPTHKELVEVARGLHAEYIIVVESVRSGKTVSAKLKVFRDRREVFKDEANLSVTLKDMMDLDSTSRSIAHTFVLRMNGGPFKGLPDQPKIKNPTLQPGQAPEVPIAPVKQDHVTTGSEIKKEIDDLAKSNKMEEAILKARDAVDSQPFDLDRRLQLIELLQSGNPEVAAVEARRAAAMLPDKVELRVLAARAWIQAGRSDEAQKDLNEAVARDPNAIPTRLLLAEISLQQLEPTKALGHLDEIIKSQDSPSARFLRALCRSLLGGVDGMQIDLAQVIKLEPSSSSETQGHRYVLTVDVLDSALGRDISDLRTLIPKIVVKPKDETLKEQAEQMLRLLQTRTTFLSLISVPSANKLAQDQRLLAHKLLTQSVLDIQSYANSRDEDLLAEARINVGEAQKQLTAAKNLPAK